MKNNYFILLITAILIIGLQAYFPAVTVSNVSLTPDLILVFLTFVAISNGPFYATLIGFILGFVQDFTTQVYLLGTFSFVKSLNGYILGSLYQYHQIWTKKVRFLLVIGCYFLHFLIYYYILFAGNPGAIITILKLATIHSLINFIIFLLTDKILFNSRFA